MKKSIFLFSISFFLWGFVPSVSSAPSATGSIAYIGLDDNVHVYAPRDDESITITDDGNDRNHYQWPTWANNGMLAYFCCEGHNQVKVFMSSNGQGTGELIYTSPSNTQFTYAYWSPSNCQTGINCRDLAILLNHPAQPFTVELVRVQGDEISSKIVGTGAPFYYSWSPNAQKLLTQRNNADIDIYDINTSKFDEIGLLPGLSQAPSWSPIGDRLLLVTSNDNGTSDIVTVEQHDVTNLQHDIAGLVAANWSPDTAYVAYRSISDTHSSPLIVIDSVTGKIITQTNDDDIIAFFWSPDSRSIAYVTLMQSDEGFIHSQSHQLISTHNTQQQASLVWTILDVEDGNIRRLARFFPTSEMVYCLNFFDQFAQSHRIWSPESTHIVYGQIDENGNSRISILDTTRSNTVPFTVADGVIGIWSFN